MERIIVAHIKLFTRQFLYASEAPLLPLTLKLFPNI